MFAVVKMNLVRSFVYIFCLLLISNFDVFAKRRHKISQDKKAQIRNQEQVYPPFAARYYEGMDKFRDYYFYPLGQATYEEGHIYWKTFLNLFNYDRHFYKKRPYSEGKFFPIYFFKEGFGKSNDYAAVWPLGGTVKNFWGKEQADWFLWPLWVKTTQGKTYNYWFPWPFINYRCGISHGFGLWPMGGHFYQTGVYDDRYMLWPLIYHRKDFDKNAIKNA